MLWATSPVLPLVNRIGCGLSYAYQIQYKFDTIVGILVLHQDCLLQWHLWHSELRQAVLIDPQPTNSSHIDELHRCGFSTTPQRQRYMERTDRVGCFWRAETAIFIIAPYYVDKSSGPNH
jgi:hypothetical protein